jgi:hypothetical protein
MASLSEHLGGQFKAEEHPDTFGIITPGEYVAQIVDSDIVETKKKDGQMAKFTFEIMEGEFEKRLLWVNCNIVNPSVQAQAIGQKELAKIAVAAGISEADDTEEFHYKPMLITVGVRKYTDNSGVEREQSIITKYQRLTAENGPLPDDEMIAAKERLAPKSATKHAPASTASASTGNAKPWQRKAA